MPPKIIKYKKIIEKPQKTLKPSVKSLRVKQKRDDTDDGTDADSDEYTDDESLDESDKKEVVESSLSQIYRIINDPRLKNIGSEFLEKLMYLYFIYLAQKGVGATFMAFDSLLSAGFRGIIGLFNKRGEATDLDLTTIRYSEPRRKYTENELNEIRNDIYNI